MKKQTAKWIGLIAAALTIAGCYSMNDQTTMSTYDGRPCFKLGGGKAKAEPAPAPEPGGPLVWYLPIENPAEAVVKVTSYTQTDIMKGVAFDYKVVVENISGYMLDEVTVSDVLSPGISLKNSSPEAKLSMVDAGGCTGKLCPLPSDQYTKAQWFLGCLPSGESRTVTATATANKEGTFAHCIDVAYIAKMCQQFIVAAPKLDIDKVMPAETLIDTPFPVEITVWNDGSGLLKNIKVTDMLPEGLVEVNSGSRNISFDVPELAPGQPRKYAFQAKADRTGEFTNVAKASAGGLEAEDSEVINVIRPLIGIEKDGPARVSLGREAQYRIKVMNKGNAPVSQLVVTDIIPADSAFVSASDNGSYNEGVVSWNLGSMDAGKSRTLTVTVRARGIGTMVNRTQATAANCPAVSDDASTVVEGVAALLMEVVDDPDPVLIGDTTTYTITIQNQGTSMGRNIRVKAFLEDEQSFVSAGGASQPVKQGAETEFGPVNIAPGASAVWKVTAKAEAAADVRFKSVMKADSFERTVEETEATTLY